MIENAGYYVSIYASTSWINNQLNMNDFKAYDVWVAQYNTKVTYKGPYGICQNTSKGRLNGYKGNLDINYAYEDYLAIMKARDLNGYSKEGEVAPTPSQPVPKPDPVPPKQYEKGKQIKLSNTKLYASSPTTKARAIINVNCYTWDEHIYSNRIRIINSASKAGKVGQVTGWIDVNVIE